MYGALLGDMIGAPYEFDRGDKTKSFPLFSGASHFTDDSVMTIAVADALLELDKNADEESIHYAVIKSMRIWGRKYYKAGYGRRFSDWLFTHWQPKPYGSYGNGNRAPGNRTAGDRTPGNRAPGDRTGRNRSADLPAG